MIIEIREIPEGQKLSRITVDFDNGAPKTTIQTSQTSQDGKSGKSQNAEPAQAIDFTTLGDIKVSQDVVEKPKVPDIKDRQIKVSQGMQNLKI